MIGSDGYACITSDDGVVPKAESRINVFMDSMVSISCASQALQIERFVMRPLDQIVIHI